MCYGSANKVKMPSRKSYVKEENRYIRAQNMGPEFHARNGYRLQQRLHVNVSTAYGQMTGNERYDWVEDCSLSL